MSFGFVVSLWVRVYGENFHKVLTREFIGKVLGNFHHTLANLIDARFEAPSEPNALISMANNRLLPASVYKLYAQRTLGHRVAEATFICPSLICPKSVGLSRVLGVVLLECLADEFRQRI